MERKTEIETYTERDRQSQSAGVESGTVTERRGLEGTLDIKQDSLSTLEQQNNNTE